MGRVRIRRGYLLRHIEAGEEVKLFCFRCKKCGDQVCLSPKPAKNPTCCGEKMVRDYKTEGVGNTFHPSKGDR